MGVIDYRNGLNERPREWLKTLLLVGGLLAAAAVIVFVVVNVLVFTSLKPPTVDRMAFDARTWKAASAPDASFKSVRLRMADDFLATRQPVGKSRAEIVALLGEPDQTPYFRRYDMVYYLGPERSAFSIDSEWLVLKLTDGVVTEARLVRD